MSNAHIDFEIDTNWKLDVPKVRMASRLAVLYTANYLQEALGREAPKDTRRLSNSFTVTPYGDLGFNVGTEVHYARYVTEGTGLFGPRNQRIYPENATVLVFEINGRPVFARSVAGQRPNDFVDRAIDSTERRIEGYMRYSLTQVGLE